LLTKNVKTKTSNFWAIFFSAAFFGGAFILLN